MCFPSFRFFPFPTVECAFFCFFVWIFVLKRSPAFCRAIKERVWIFRIFGFMAVPLVRGIVGWGACVRVYVSHLSVQIVTSRGKAMKPVCSFFEANNELPC